MHSVHVPLSFTACLGSAALLIQPDVCFLRLFLPSTGSSHLLDTLVRLCPARSQSQYLLGSQPLSSPPAGPSAMPGTAYTSVGFKSVSTTQIKARHSRTSVSPFYSIWCSVYWHTACTATCLPPSRHKPIPSAAVSILDSCRSCPLSAAEMIARLSACDLFMLPIKLISPQIIVKAWHWKMGEDDTSSDYMAQWWHRLAGVPLHRSLSCEKGRGGSMAGCFIVPLFDWVAMCQDYQPMPSARVLHPQRWIDWDLL